MQDRFKFRVVLKTSKIAILVEPYYILKQGCFIDINKAEKVFQNKYPDDCFWDFIDEIKKQDCIQEISTDGEIIITKDFSNLLQCTGLKDKTGRLIYEGDIVKDDHDAWHYYVRWVYDSWQLFPCTQNNYTIGIVDDEVEVIGNIYENSELLKGCKKWVNMKNYASWLE